MRESEMAVKGKNAEEGIEKAAEKIKAWTSELHGNEENRITIMNPKSDVCINLFWGRMAEFRDLEKIKEELRDRLVAFQRQEKIHNFEGLFAQINFNRGWSKGEYDLFLNLESGTIASTSCHEVTELMEEALKRSKAPQVQHDVEIFNNLKMRYKNRLVDLYRYDIAELEKLHRNKLHAIMSCIVDVYGSETGKELTAQWHEEVMEKHGFSQKKGVK